MIRPSIVATAAVLVAACLAPPLAARPADDGHHAADRPVALADWINRIETEVDRQLAAQRTGNRVDRTGVVRVKFNCSETGRTDKVSVLRSSGSLDLDLAAAQAVRRVAVMHPLATGIRTDQVYFADIVFGTADNESYRHERALRRDAAAKTNAWFQAPGRAALASR